MVISQKKIIDTTNFDRLLAIVGLILPFIQLLKTELDKRDTRHRLNDSLKKPTQNLEKSVNDLLHAYQLILGSSIFYRIMEPNDADKEIENLMGDFKRKYKKVLVDTKKLIKHLDIYDSELAFISDNESRFTLKHIKQAFNEKTPDFSYILGDKKFQKIIQKTFKENKTFNEKLNRALKKTSSELDLKLTFVEKMRTIFLSKSFQKDVQELVEKQLKKEKVH